MQKRWCRKPVATCYESFSTQRNMFLDKWVIMCWCSMSASIGSFQIQCVFPMFLRVQVYFSLYAVWVSRKSPKFFGFKSWCQCGEKSPAKNGSQATLAGTFCQTRWMHLVDMAISISSNLRVSVSSWRFESLLAQWAFDLCEKRRPQDSAIDEFDLKSHKVSFTFTFD